MYDVWNVSFMMQFVIDAGETKRKPLGYDFGGTYIMDTFSL